MKRLWEGNTAATGATSSSQTRIRAKHEIEPPTPPRTPVSGKALGGGGRTRAASFSRPHHCPGNRGDRSTSRSTLRPPFKKLHASSGANRPRVHVEPRLRAPACTSFPDRPSSPLDRRDGPGPKPLAVADSDLTTGQEEDPEDGRNQGGSSHPRETSMPECVPTPWGGNSGTADPAAVLLNKLQRRGQGPGSPVAPALAPRG